MDKPLVQNRNNHMKLFSCLMIKRNIYTFQVAEVVLQEGQSFDFSVITQLVMILSARPSNEIKGIMCLVCWSILPLQSVNSLVDLDLLEDYDLINQEGRHFFFSFSLILCNV